MSMTAQSLPDDVAALKAIVLAQANKIERRDATIESLRDQIKALIDYRFGRSSEQLGDQDASQFGLFDEAEVQAQELEEDSGTVVAGHVRRGKRAPLPAHLTRIEILHDLPDDQKVCPHDGTPLKRIGEQTAEQLDIVPMTVRVLRHIRATYACPCCEQHIVTAQRPPALLPKSQASEGTVAYVATSKYVDGLPLNRIANVLGRIGVDAPRQTLANWMIGAGEGITPMIGRLVEHLLACGTIQMDETRVQVLQEPGKTAESQSYMWVRTGGDELGRPIRLFDYAPSRSGQVPTELLQGFRGYLHTDGYEGYAAPAAHHGLTQVFCWAHCRRYYVRALKALGINPKQLPAEVPPKAKRLIKGLRFIQKLYGIERKIKDEPPERRQQVRQEEAIPILAEFKDWIEQVQPKVTPTSGIGKALSYTVKYWDGLVRYVEDGRLEIDTNRTENAIRPFVLGRKAWLFSASTQGAKASANLYSLIETAKANGLEPYAYLKAVFAALPSAKTDDDIDRLLPWNINLT